MILHYGKLTPAASRAIRGCSIDNTEVDSLYRLSPENFVPARDSLARALRSAGEREGAAQVKALRRPSAGAWLVNQLAREHGDALDELLATGAALRSTQTAVLTGHADGAQLLVLTATRRQQIDALVSAARTLAQAADRKTAPLDAVDATLVAASSDEAAADAVRSGRLVKELSYSGFGMTEDPADAVAPALRAVRKPRSSRPERAKAPATRVIESPKPAPAGSAHRPTPPRNLAAGRREAAATAAATALQASQNAVHGASGRADDAQRAFDALTREIDRVTAEERRLAAELTKARGRLGELRESQRAARGAARSAHTEAERARSLLVRAQQKLDHLR